MLAPGLTENVLTGSLSGMYEYYKNAVVCYVYLTDYKSKSGESVFSGLKNCLWFKRSWTLQEMIAPANLAFYDKDWTFIGMKSDLLKVLTKITRVDEKALNGSADLMSFSVAKKMSCKCKVNIHNAITRSPTEDVRALLKEKLRNFFNCECVRIDN